MGVDSVITESASEVQCEDCTGSGYSKEGRACLDLWYGSPSFVSPAPVRVTHPTVVARARWVLDWNLEHPFCQISLEAEAERLAKLFNSCWMHNLSQEDVDALLAEDRLWDFTRKFIDGEWRVIDPKPCVLAAQVNEWSILGGLGHDIINRAIVIEAKCKRDGVSTWCETCGGRGVVK